MISGKRILIYNDFEPIRVFIADALKRKNYSIMEASNQAEAINILSEKTFDLLITDFDMPENAAETFIERIRGLSTYMFTPVVLLSSAKKEQVKPKLQHLNIAYYLQKPFDIVEFYSIIEKLR